MPRTFSAEPAKSGRSSCKGCNVKIQKDELRMGVHTEHPGMSLFFKHFLFFYFANAHKPEKKKAKLAVFSQPKNPKTKKIKIKKCTKKLKLENTTQHTTKQH